MLQESSKLIIYGIKTRRAWWFTATARTRARFSRTVIGSLWLGIANLLFSLVLGGVYGVVFKVPNVIEYFIIRVTIVLNIIIYYSTSICRSR